MELKNYKLISRSNMQTEIDKYFEEARNCIKDKTILESVVRGMKAVVLEATGECPCGDPDCNGNCGYGLEDKDDSAKSTNEAMEVLEEARGDMKKEDFVKALAEAIDGVTRAPLRERLKAKLEIYKNK